MTPSLFEPVPFLTRKMLSFEHAAKLELRVSVISNLTEPLVLQGMTREGVFKYNFSSQPDGFVHRTNFRLTDIPIWLSVSDNLGSAAQGEVHCVVDLLVNGDPVLKMCSGWVNVIKDLSWPVQNILDSRLGGGKLYSYLGSDKAAGIECSDNTPLYDVYRLISYRVTLVTDATVATRNVHIRILDVSGNIIMEAFPAQSQLASTTNTYMFHPLGAVLTALNNGIIPVIIPANLYIPGGSTITTNTLSLQAGDNFGAPNIYVEQFFN